MLQKNKNLKEITISQKIVLQQLNYWLSKNDSRYGIFREGKQWIRNSYAAWQKQIGSFSVITIRRAFAELEKLGLVQSKTFEEGKKFCGGEQVKYFTIDFDRLEELLNRSKPLGNKTLSNVNKTSNLIGEGDQNDHPYLSNKTSNLKKSHKKNLNLSKSQSAQQDGKFKNIFDSEQIQKILSMKQIWNSEIEGKSENITFEEISRCEQAYLFQALAQYFSNDLNSWKSFCQKITTSCFLMGEKTSFRVNLPWVLRFSNLQKILDGNLYGIGDRTSQPFKTHEFRDEKPLSFDLDMDVKLDGFVQETMIQEALMIRQILLKRVGEGNYISWFSKARLVLNDQRKYVLCVENAFIKNSIKNRFELDLKGLIDEVCLIGEEDIASYKDNEAIEDDEGFKDGDIAMVEEHISSSAEKIIDSSGSHVPLDCALISKMPKNILMPYRFDLNETPRNIPKGVDVLKGKERMTHLCDFSSLKYVVLKDGFRKQILPENDIFLCDNTIFDSSSDEGGRNNSFSIKAQEKSFCWL